MTIERRIPTWRSYIPILDVVLSYQRRDFGGDLVAGIVLGLITIPQAVAYALLAGLPPVAGLYASLVPMLVYAILGSSRELVVGPVAVSAMLVAETVRTHAHLGADAYLGVALVMSLETGLLLWALRATQMGGIVNLLSSPANAGFVNAAGLLIVLSQIPAFFGLAATDGSPFAQALRLFEHMPDFNPAATLIGIAALAIIWVMRCYGFYLVLPFLHRVGRQHPITRTGPVLAVLASTLIVAGFALDQHFAVAVIGEIPGGLPTPTLPHFDLALWIDILPNAAIVALVSYVSSYSIATSLAGRRHRAINSNQELIALGAANISAAFTGAYPVAGSFSRSSINVASGGRTPLSAVVCMLVVLATLMWFTPYFARLPDAALAAIIIASVVDMIDLRPIYRNWRFYPYDSYTHVATLAAVLLFSVEEGLLIGILIAVALFVRRSSKPHLAVLGRVGNSDHFRNRRNYPVTTYPGVLAVRIDENLYFANANNVENRLLKLIERDEGTRHVLLVCSAINFIDTSGLELLVRLNRKLERDGVRLHLAEVKAPVQEQLRASPLPELLSGRIFFTTDEAVRTLAEGT